MLAEREIEGRFVWKDEDRDGKQKVFAYYFTDKKSRLEALKYVGGRTYDYFEHRAEEDPKNDDRLVYKKV